MLLETLEDLPPVRVPEGYTLRSFQEGDDAHWERVMQESFQRSADKTRFGAMMRSDPAFRPERVLFICRDGVPVATSSAWHMPQYGERMGHLHYVAVVPSETGRGLGLQISLACLHRMKEEERATAMLLTDDFRIPAIKTYLKLGFRPLMMHEGHRQRWPEVFERIDPGLIHRFAGIISGPLYDPGSPSE